MEQLNSVKAKLQLLKFANAQTSGAVEFGERLKNTLAKNVEEVHHLKVKVEELRFEGGHEDGEIQTWTANLKTKLGVFGKAIEGLDVTINEFKTAAHGAAKKKGRKGRSTN